MKHLLNKEFRLAMHPTNLIFLTLSAMLLIPDYPYYVIFFYTTLGLFFVCLNGRENHDIEYSLTLPIRKRQIVEGRIAFTVVIELLQVALAIPFAWLRAKISPAVNTVGMDANIALFGFTLLMFGLFNWFFVTAYYKAPAKVGKAFLVASTAVMLYIVVAETLAHALPFIRDCLDAPDPQFLGVKLATLGIGAALYALITYAAYRTAAKRFEALDL